MNTSDPPLSVYLWLVPMCLAVAIGTVLFWAGILKWLFL